MKHTIRTTISRLIFITVILAFIGISCKGFLEEDPKTFLKSDGYLSNEADADAALNSIYRIPDDRYSNMWGAPSWFEWATDECELTPRNNWPQHNQPAQLTTDFNSLSFTPWNFWDCAYRGIKNANYLLGNIEQINMDVTRKKQITAQARAFRALFYFDLVKVYNGAPLVLTYTSDSGEGPTILNKLSRAKPEDMYKAIEDDLKAAIADLPVEWTKAIDAGRLTKGAAAGLLARVYLAWSGYPIKDLSKLQEAKTILTKFIVNKEYGSQYGLFNTYAEAFADKNIPGKESVWTINFTRGTFGAGSDIHTNLAPLEIYDKLGLSGGGGWSNGLPTNMFYNSYDKIKDQRFAFTWWTSTADIAEYAALPNPIVFTRPHCKKFREPTPNNNSQRTGIDHYIIRYADVLLMYAEVLNELGDNGCYTYINLIRNRAGLDNLPNMSQSDFRNHLMLERAWELAFEGERKFDLVRWGIYTERVKVWNPQAAPNVVKGKHEFWPIPQRERDINSNLTQNNGY